MNCVIMTQKHAVYKSSCPDFCFLTLKYTVIDFKMNDTGFYE